MIRPPIRGIGHLRTEGQGIFPLFFFEIERKDRIKKAMKGLEATPILSFIQV